MPASPIIEIKNLSAGYDNRTVLHDINLTIYERDFLGIIGPNGGGKTTLIKCILGLLKPTTGEILYHSCPPSPSEIANCQLSTVNCQLSMGYLPQYSSIDRKFPITVEEVILSGLSSKKPLASRFTARHREKASAVIARMGLEGMEQRAIGALSGGQLQRALLGPCHHLRPAGGDSRRTQHIHRQAFRSPPLRTAGRDKQGLRHYSRQPRHRHGVAASQVHCLRQRNPGLPSRYRRYGRMAGTQLQLPDRVAGARDTAAQDIERTQAFSRMTGSKGGRPIVEPTSRYPSE